MRVWVRHLAWLHAVPDKGKGKEKETRSRWALLKGKKSAELPELDWGQHLTESLLEFGPSMPGPNGPVPVSWQELDAWAKRTNTVLPGWEALLLRKLSKDYCDQYAMSGETNCPQPVAEGAVEEARTIVSQGFAALIAQHKKK